MTGRRSKTALSCTVAFVVVTAGVITLFGWLYISLENDPIKGWLEDPYTPSSPPRVHVSPEPSSTAKPTTHRPTPGPAH